MRWLLVKYANVKAHQPPVRLPNHEYTSARNVFFFRFPGRLPHLAGGLLQVVFLISVALLLRVRNKGDDVIGYCSYNMCEDGSIGFG